MTLFGIHLDLNPSYGIFLVGTFISNVLLGATCIQTYMYLRSFRDTLLIKATVLIVLVLELLHGAFSIHGLYHYLISNFLDPLRLVATIWSINILFSITGAIIFLVHASYAIRIYHISGKKLPIPIFITILSLVNFAFGLTLTAKLFQNPSITNLSGIRNHLAKAVLISAAIVDFLIAGTLTYYLNKSRTGIKQTDKIIDKLMIYAINNGILTSLTDIVALIFVFVFPNDLYSEAISQIIGNLYSNSLMATLNSRRTLKTISEPLTCEVASYGISTLRVATNPQIQSQLTESSLTSLKAKSGRQGQVQNLTLSGDDSV